MTTLRAATIAYVANADSQEIFVLAMNPDSGALAVLERVPVAGTVMPLAVSPDKRFLYASLRSEPHAAASFAIDPATGRLRHLATATLADSMAYIATDRSGRWLLGASYGGHKLAINPIDPQGAVLAEPSRTVPTPPNAHAVLTDPSNRYLFATSLGGDVVIQQRFDAATGAVTPNHPAAMHTATGAGPRHFVFQPQGRFVYLINELDASLYVLGFDAASGTLAQRHTASTLPPGFQGKPSAADLHITPDGRFLYGSERATSTIAGFRVEDGGARLTPIGSTPTETQPRGFAIDPRGRFLLAAGQLSHGLTVYAIDQETGSLTPLERYAMGRNPNWIEIIDLP